MANHFIGEDAAHPFVESAHHPVHASHLVVTERCRGVRWLCTIARDVRRPAPCVRRIFFGEAGELLQLFRRNKGFQLFLMLEQRGVSLSGCVAEQVSYAALPRTEGVESLLLVLPKSWRVIAPVASPAFGWYSRQPQALYMKSTTAAGTSEMGRIVIATAD